MTDRPDLLSEKHPGFYCVPAAATEIRGEAIAKMGKLLRCIISKYPKIRAHDLDGIKCHHAKIQQYDNFQQDTTPLDTGYCARSGRANDSTQNPERRSARGT